MDAITQFQIAIDALARRLRAEYLRQGYYLPW
jgi:hypothetical protein